MLISVATVLGRAKAAGWEDEDEEDSDSDVDITGASKAGPAANYQVRFSSKFPRVQFPFSLIYSCTTNQC